MNDVMASECTSGCESGWTLYLEQSFLSLYPSIEGMGVVAQEKITPNQEELELEEEDLSMVSDASSGPPHFHDDQDYREEHHKGCFYNASFDPTLVKKNGKKQKIKDRKVREQNHSSFLDDDTASSPIFNFNNGNFNLTANNQASPENIMEFSQGHPTTHFQGRTSFQDHFSSLQSSLTGNQLQHKQRFDRTGRKLI